MHIESTYSYQLILVSVLIAITVAYASFALTDSIRSTTTLIGRAFYLLNGSVSLGLGIWSMHYLGMLALQLPVDVSYSVPEVMLSLLLAIAASAVALTVVSSERLGWKRLAVGGLMMGAGIGGMHYTGMAAMRMNAMHHYTPWIAALSLVVAVSSSVCALWIGFAVRRRVQDGERLRIGAGILMGLGIAATHYTAMAAVTYTQGAMTMPLAGWTIQVGVLGKACVAIAAAVVLGSALAMSVLDKRKFRDLQRAQSSLLEKQVELLQDRQQLYEEKMELLEINSVLSELSIRDGLTGLYNRRQFDMVFQTEYDRAVRDNGRLALLMIDVDCFKALNDCNGRDAGDECLRSLADLLENRPRRGHDVAARYGGEEFILLLPGATVAGALAVAERVRHAVLSLAIPHGASTVGPFVTVSIGVAAGSPSRNDDAEEFLRAVDGALYCAKATGRNRVVQDLTLQFTAESMRPADVQLIEHARQRLN